MLRNEAEITLFPGYRSWMNKLIELGLDEWDAKQVIEKILIDTTKEINTVFSNLSYTSTATDVQEYVNVILLQLSKGKTISFNK